MDLKGGLNAIFLKARAAVSQDNQRYINDGWNLDLTYVTPRVIAMGVPGESVAAAYRNPLTEVAAFLHQNHANHFLVFNLSCIRYDYSKLDNRVVEYFFMDHHPPPLDLLLSVVQAMRAFLAAHPDNVVVVHCKAGRGRTGVVISSFLFREGICKEPQEAVELFSLIRTSTPGCVEFYSQRRYVEYFAQVVRNDLLYYIKPVILERVTCKRVPDPLYVGTTSWRQLPFMEIRSLATNQVLYTTANEPYSLIIDGDTMTFTFHKQIEGDILMRFFARTGSLLSSILESETFRICFNTYFLPRGAFVIPKREIDFQPRDDRFTEDFSVQIDVSPVPLALSPAAASAGPLGTPLQQHGASFAPSSLNISQSPNSDSYLYAAAPRVHAGYTPDVCPPSNGNNNNNNNNNNNSNEANALPCPPPPHRAPPPPPSPTASPSPSPSPVPSSLALSSAPPSTPSSSSTASLQAADDLPRSPPLPVAMPPPAAVPTLASLDIYQSFRTSPALPHHAEASAAVVQSPQVAMPLPPTPTAANNPPPKEQLSIIGIDDEIAAYLQEEKNENMRIVG